MGTDGLARRIARLKDANPAPCGACRFDPGAPIAAYTVEWADSEGPDEPEYCAACGRADRIVVTWAEEVRWGEGDT